jgi:hypothetical protein
MRELTNADLILVNQRGGGFGSSTVGNATVGEAVGEPVVAEEEEDDGDEARRL